MKSSCFQSFRSTSVRVILFTLLRSAFLPVEYYIDYDWVRTLVYLLSSYLTNAVSSRKSASFTTQGNCLPNFRCSLLKFNSKLYSGKRVVLALQAPLSLDVSLRSSLLAFSSLHFLVKRQ